MAETTFTAEPNRHDATTVSLIDAPLSAVYKAYTDADLYSQWWAPPELTARVDRFEPVTGGSWRIVNVDADGNEYAFRGVFHEVSPERIIQTWEFEAMPGHVSLETVTFEEVAGKTKVTSHTVCQSVEDRDGLKDSGMEAHAPVAMNQLEKVAQSL